MNEKTTQYLLSSEAALAQVDAEPTFGGIKHSGCDRELSRVGIQEFVNKKLVRTGHMAVPV